MTRKDKREALDRQAREVGRLLRDRRSLVDPDPGFADRVIARLPRHDDAMLAWAARRVLPATLAVAAALTIAVLATGGQSRRSSAASTASTAQRANDPLDWLLESPGETR